jgi:DNA mismatch repair protein MutH
MPIQGQRNYKHAQIGDILKRADELVGMTVQQLISAEHSNFASWKSLNELRGLTKFNRGTGTVGHAVEELVFGMEPDNKQEADFAGVGVELKTTGLKKLGQKSKKRRRDAGSLVAKERLTLGMIDYMLVVNENWAKSSVVKKCSSLLILFYLYEKDVHSFDLEFKGRTYISDFLIDLPQQYITQIEADWRKIIAKIKRGEAHNLGSGDTSYLEASRKGSSLSPDRHQPFSDKKAPSRAFSLKANFVDELFRLSEEEFQYESSLKPKQTIEGFVDEKLSQIIGMNGEEIAQIQGKAFNQNNKSRWRQLVERQLAGDKKFSHLRELPMSFTELRVLNFEHDLALRESISFPAFDYFEVAESPWEDSSFFELLSSKRFLFAFFQKEQGDDLETLVANFIGWQFWTFPAHLLDEAKVVYEETQRRILKGHYKFTGISDSNYCHVRPHARNAAELVNAPDGTRQKKYSFWLNARFIANELLGGSNNESN